VHYDADLLILVIRNEQRDSVKDRFAAKVGKCSDVWRRLASGRAVLRNEKRDRALISRIADVFPQTGSFLKLPAR
jgi:hypothetical protein